MLDFAQDRLTSFVFRDRESKIDVCEVTFSNYDKKLLDEPRLKAGQEFLVQWGYPDNMSRIYSMIVKKSHESGTNFTVKMKGKAVSLDKGRNHRQWQGMRDSDVAMEILREHNYDGLTLDVVQTEVVYPTITQSTSDARFIQKLSKRNRFRWWIDASGAHFRPRKNDATPYKWYTYRGHFDGDGEILSPGPNIETNFASDIARIKIKGIDPYTLEEVIAEQGIAGGTAEENYAVSLGEEQEIGDPDNLESNRQGNVTRTEEINIGLATQSEVNAKAEAVYREVSERRYKMSLPVDGDPQLGAKTLIGLRNYSESSSGLYYVKEVEHQIQPGRYRCDCKTVRDATGRTYLKKKFGVGKKNQSKDPGGSSGPPSTKKLERTLTTRKGPNGETEWVYAFVKEGTNQVVKTAEVSEKQKAQLDGR
ncbi:MAG: phage late control D family protein [FCB group bacterium]|nr:phage late control D family protein [FCB group bacterium]